MATFRYYTVADALRHLQDFAGSNLKASQRRQRRTAIAAAYQHMTTLRPWRYYLKQDRLQVAAKYSTGTIAYDHTGGSSERLLTLAGGTFPSWAGRATVTLAVGEYEIDEVLTATTATLLETNNPGADVGSSTDYAIYNDRFLLPMDAAGVDQLSGVVDRTPLQWTDPRDYLQIRSKNKVEDYPAYYTLLGDVEAMGRLMLRLFPYPTSAIDLDYTYKRNPRELLFDQYKYGTITTNATTTVAGSGTDWTANMDGAILRVSYASAELDENANAGSQWFESMAMSPPFIYERRITAIGGANSLTVDSAIPALSGVRYEISDPIDIERGAMFSAFLRCCEWQLACIMRLQDRNEAQQQFELSLQAAVAVDEAYNLRREIQPPPVEERARKDNQPIQMGGK